MKTNLIKYKPTVNSFLKYLFLIFGLYAILFFFFYFIVNKGQPFAEFFSSVAIMYLLMPLFNVALFTYSSRKHQYIISEIDDTAYVADWASEVLQQNGMRLKSVEGNRTVLESTTKYYRMFNNWFGAELIEITASEHEVTATGHARYIDKLDTKIKFGKVAFKKA